MNWDDLRVALALARDRSVRGAARTLGVSHSTVVRRLAELEARVGVRLFDRKPDGYEVTSAGQDVFDTAQGLDDEVSALERRVQGRDLRLTGAVRVTLPDPLLAAVLPMCREFSAQFPEIDVTLSVALGFVDLAQREADLALRIAGDPPPDLVGRKLLLVACGVYGHESYLAGKPTQDLQKLDWVGWESESSMAFPMWMRREVPKARVAVRLNSSFAVQGGVDAGLGVAILPCAMADLRPGWRRLRLVPEMSAPLWILSHRDLRATARVRALRDFLADAVLAQRALFEGKPSKRGARRA